MINGVIIIKVKELTEIECLELALKYSVSKKHKESLLKRIESYRGKGEESKKDTINKDSNQIGQVSFL